MLIRRLQSAISSPSRRLWGTTGLLMAATTIRDTIMKDLKPSKQMKCLRLLMPSWRSGNKRRGRPQLTSLTLTQSMEAWVPIKATSSSMPMDRDLYSASLALVHQAQPSESTSRSTVKMLVRMQRMLLKLSRRTHSMRAGSSPWQDAMHLQL